MTEDNSPNERRDGEQPTAAQPEGAGSDAPTSEIPAAGQAAGQTPKRGSVRYQDSDTTPREPSLGEQRARRKALAEEEQREAQEAQARAEAARKSGTKRKVLIGAGVTVGLVGLIATYYAVASPDDVEAVCTDNNGTIVQDDNNCDEQYVTSHGGYSSGGFLFLPIPGGGYSQYRYNYGGTGTVGSRVSGGSFDRPSGANISTKSGKSVQRGGFGISGKSGTSSGS